MRPPHPPPSAAAGARLQEALESLLHATMRLARREASTSGLSMPQFFILRRIHRAGVIPATGWADQTGIRASSASGLVDGLVRGRWVVRSPDPADRRRILIRLSPSGEKLLEGIALARRRRVLAALVGMTPRELARATEVAEELAARFADSTKRTGSVRGTSPRASGPRRGSVRTPLRARRRGARNA